MTRLLLGGRLVGLWSSIAGVVVGLGLALALIAASGGPPAAALEAIFDGAFGSVDRVGATIARMVPLLLVGLGWILASSGGHFNVGMDGQIVAGGILAGALGIAVALPTGIHLAVAIGAGIVGGLMWAGIATALWVWRGVNVIVSTLMLNLVAIQVLAWLVRGPLKQKGQAFPHSEPIPGSAQWPQVDASSGLNWDILLVLALVATTALVLTRTTFGVRLRLTVANENAARSAGIRTTRIRTLALLLSGGVAGLAGSSLILGGQSRVVSDGFNSTYGFDGIAVALVARNSPWACIPTALLFAGLRQGGGLLEVRLQISSAIVFIAEGIVIVLVAGSVILSRRIQRRMEAQREPEARPGALPAPPEVV